MDASRQPGLILRCGIPGSGTTTSAKRLEKEISAVLLGLDEWLVDLDLDRPVRQVNVRPA